MGIRNRVEKGASERWAAALQGMPDATRDSYQREFREFLEFLDESPEGLVSFWGEIMNDPGKNMQLSDAVNDYLSELDDQGYGGGKQDMTVKAVRRFFKTCGFSPVLDVKSRSRNQGSRPATKDEVRRLIAYAITTPRSQALVACIKDNGLRPSDLARVTLGDIKPLIDDSNLEWLVFKMPVLKTRRLGKVALPCFGPDAVRYLRLWLAEREGLGFGAEPEAPVFVTVRDSKDYEAQGRAVRGSEPGQPMGAGGITVTVNDLCERAGLPELSCNSLRKYMTSRLSVAGMPMEKIKYIQGKSQGSSVEHYLNYEIEEILPVYQAAYHELALEGDESRELEALKSREAARDEEIQRMRDELYRFMAQFQHGVEHPEDSPEEQEKQAKDIDWTRVKSR